MNAFDGGFVVDIGEGNGTIGDFGLGANNDEIAVEYATTGHAVAFNSNSKEIRALKHLGGIDGDVEVQVAKIEDGESTGAKGKLTYGNPSADTVIEGGTITVDGPTTFVEAVGIGTTNPVEKLEVQWDAAVDVMIGRATNDTDQTFISLRSPDGTQWYITANDTGTVSAVTTKP